LLLFLLVRWDFLRWGEFLLPPTQRPREGGNLFLVLYVLVLLLLLCSYIWIELHWWIEMIVCLVGRFCVSVLLRVARWFATVYAM
jgi:hypothetical protein